MMEVFLIEKRGTVLKGWTDRIFSTYPAGSITFLRGNRDPFNNPVGNTITGEAGVLYDQMLGPMDKTIVTESLDRIIKIRAVQEFSPSEAISFVFLLKDVLLKELSNNKGMEIDHKRLHDIFFNIDRMALMAFDIHAECRARIHKIRVDEARMSAFMRRERIIRKENKDDDKER